MSHSKNNIRHCEHSKAIPNNYKDYFNRVFLAITPLFLVLPLGANAQFAPSAEQPGSTAIYKDSSVFVEWATICNTQLGWQNMADTTLGKTNSGTDSSAIGRAGENGTVSLGDGGVATLQFANPLYNGDGWDFAVFENGFTDSFLELAFVEVSSDGENFVRFPSVSHTQVDSQVGGFGYLNAEKLNNLAGKYRANYGTPFDLEELRDSMNIDINNIKFVRVIDVVGSIDSAYATYDSEGNKVNDPFPTPFATGGFDLDAVGVIHSLGTSGIANISGNNFSVYPNPTTGKVFFEKEISNGILRDLQGKIVAEISGKNADFSNLENGIYILELSNQLSNYKLILSK